ncbi:hypothetical protein BDF21DRAFT_406520 [Thamnidium elegans]|nr:hypothetical protein BDF21DRAFT_406520 [Thamnidium elegans]
MSTYSQNLFAVLSESGDVRPEPVAAPKEEKKVEPKSDKKRSAKSAAGGATREVPQHKRESGHHKTESRARRQLDRHSGTGIVDTEKKVNQGWGHPGTAEYEGAKDPFDPADPDAPEKDATAPVEEEEQVKTLDEYLAEKANKSLKVSLPEARKANDADESAFKGVVALTKQEEVDFYAPKETKPTKKATEKSRNQKVLVDIEQRFEDKSSRDDTRGGRGGRGGSRGGRGVRGARGGRGDRDGRDSNSRRGGNNNSRKESTKSPAVNIQDTVSFPSLGA